MVTKKLVDFSMVEELYHTRLIKDFPPMELKPLEMMRVSWEMESYDCYGLFEREEILGYAFFLRKGRKYLLDYYAIDEKYRGTGLGSGFLRQLAEYMEEADCVIIEVENPASAKDEEARKHMQRRLHFYLRNGCRETGVTSILFGVNYRLLEIAGRGAHGKEELRAAYTEIYQSILPERFFQTSFLVG